MDCKNCFRLIGTLNVPGKALRVVQASWVFLFPERQALFISAKLTALAAVQDFGLPEQGIELLTAESITADEGTGIEGLSGVARQFMEDRPGLQVIDVLGAF